MIPQGYFKGLPVVNNLRGFHDKNNKGQHDKLIAQTIINFCKNNLDSLIQISIKDPTIAEICNLPIPELQNYWRSILLEQSIESVDDNQLYDQVMTHFLPQQAFSILNLH